MFKYFRIRSQIFIQFTWLLLFATFADAVNLDDYLPHSFSIHLDDIDMSDQNVIDSILSIMFNPADEAQNADYQVPFHSHKNIVVLYDLDSLALAASASFEKETIRELLNNKLETTQLSTERIETNNSLFSQHRSLLI